MSRELCSFEKPFDPLNPPLPKIEVGNALLTEKEYDNLLEEIEGSNGQLCIPKLGFIGTMHKSFIPRAGSGKLRPRLHKHSRGDERVAEERRHMRDSAINPIRGRLFRLSTIPDDNTVDSTTCILYLPELPPEVPTTATVSKFDTMSIRAAFADRLIKNYLAGLPE